MKILLIFFLFISLHSFGQDWSNTTHIRSEWTFAGTNGSGTHIDTSYQCTFSKKGSNITFSHVVKGVLHTSTVLISEQSNYPTKDHSEPFGIKDGEVCTVYYTNGQGVVIYYPTKKKVRWTYPKQWEYVYY